MKYEHFYVEIMFIVQILVYKCDGDLLYVMVYIWRELWVFEIMVLRRICVPRRDEVTEEWRRFHNEELNDLYF